MNGRLDYPGEMTAAEMTEAALHTAASLQPAWSKVLSTVSAMLHAALAVLVGLGLLHLFLVEPDGEGFGLPVVGIMVLIGFLWVWGVPQILFRAIYGRVVRAPFQEGLRIGFGPEGVEHWNGRSRWTTHWSDVTAAVRTKRTICIVASGIALPVALRHVDDPDALMARIAAWREAAR